MSECEREASIMRRPSPITGSYAIEIKIFSEVYKSLRPIIKNFLHPPLDISLLRANAFLFVPFSTLTLRSLINVQDRIHIHIKQQDKLNCVDFNL